jgi:hypothetical protein
MEKKVTRCMKMNISLEAVCEDEWRKGENEEECQE